ncbi:MAG: phosphoribosyltransferase family protein [Verrucomicrobiota bacterium]
MTFDSRKEAGRKLAELLERRAVRAEVVLGLPRGGVVVAAEVARRLKLPLDVLVVRKIGHPEFREFAVGALAEDGSVLLHEGDIRSAALQEVIAEERTRLADYCAKFHHRRKLDLRNKSVLIVDDGLATGATVEAACRAARHLGAREVTVAVPVASEDAAQRVAQIADQTVTLLTDPNFEAVGQYFLDFSQTTDDEVVELLRRQSGAEN